MSGFIRSALLMGVTALSACAGRSNTAQPKSEGPAILEVENRGFADMVIYAVTGSQRLRLGLATGNSTKSFPLPSSLVQGAGPIRFLADPIGGTRTPVSEEMVIQPGDVVTLTIPP
jgi:hypothetical protein